MWFQESEGAKFWLQVLNDLKQRGVQDILIACVDGLKGFPDAIEAVFSPGVGANLHRPPDPAQPPLRPPAASVSRSPATSARFYSASDADTALQALEQFDDKWGERFPPISKSWRDAWEQVIPFLA